MLPSDKLNKLDTFFSQHITPKEFSEQMRRFMDAAVQLSLEDTNNRFKEDLSGGYYWLKSLLKDLQ